MTMRFQTTGPASFPLKQNTNNNITTAYMGMPFKPDTMTQGSDFAGARHAYINNCGAPLINSPNAFSHSTTTTYTNRPIKVSVSNSNSNSLLQAGKKKNYNVSAAEHIYLKKINAVGKSSTKQVLPPNTPMSFSGVDQTSVKNGLARCRGGGCVAPKKKGAIL
jgi:hypothetical protein